MGHNKKLRRKIAAQARILEDHERKSREEQAKLEPDEGLIRSWQRETEAARRRIHLLTRRLKREW